MILLQTIPNGMPASKEAMYVIAIVALVSALGFLVRYINKLHIRHEKRVAENTQQIITIVEKNTEANTKLTVAVSNNSVAQKESASEISRGMDRLGNLINENTKTIIQNHKGDR